MFCKQRDPCCFHRLPGGNEREHALWPGCSRRPCLRVASLVRFCLVRTVSGALLERDQLVSAQQALKQHYILLTSLVSRANDIAAADARADPDIHGALVQMLLRYLATDMLLCWAPETNRYEPR
jgi:hypothetical protein